MKKLFFILSLSFLLNSCFVGKAVETSKMKSEFTEKNNAIPPEFGEDKNTVLLVLKRDRKSYDKGFKSALKEYSGKYLLISKKRSE